MKVIDAPTGGIDDKVRIVEVWEFGSSCRHGSKSTVRVLNTCPGAIWSMEDQHDVGELTGSVVRDVRSQTRDVIQD